jgi:uncharacterized protein YbjQ (UPF0145 family)
LEPGIRAGVGIEIDQVKVDKASHFIQRVVSVMADLHGVDLLTEGRNVPVISCCSIEMADIVNGATHAYSFWEGIPEDGKKAFGRMFSMSRTLKAAAVVQRAFRGRSTPEEAMCGLGFGVVRLVGNYKVSQQYSQRQYQAYIFEKV